MENGYVKLFKSYKEGFKDGEQLRDFVYVKDVVDIMYFMLTNDVKSGIYNIGTGKARSFMDLSMATMRAASHNDNLDNSLEEGVKDYVQNYLAKEDSYL